MPAKTSNFGLIDRAMEGDQEAFSLLFEKHRRRLAVLIHYKLGPQTRDGVDVDDVLQETFLKAFRDITSFTYQAPGSFMRWLSRIADHTIADLARYRARQRRDPGELVRLRSESNPEGPEPADTRTPIRVLTETEGVLALMKRLDALPEDYRQAILLAKVEGLSTAEMAERLGRTREAVSLLLHRAIQRFRVLTERGE